MSAPSTKLGICGPSNPALQWPARRSAPTPWKRCRFHQANSGSPRLSKHWVTATSPSRKPAIVVFPTTTDPPVAPAISCVPICPVGAKSTRQPRSNGSKEKARPSWSNSVVYKVETNARNKIEAVHYYDQHKQSHRITGKLFVLACNGLENPKLLLMSADDRNPNGVANPSDQVGRNMMDHPQLTLTVTTREPFWSGVGPMVNYQRNYRNFQGAFRSEHAGAYFRYNNFGAIASSRSRIEKGHDWQGAR